MQTWHPSNPVERRLVAVHDDWLRFRSDEHARVLHWQVSEADQRMLAVYVQRQHKLSSAVFELTSRFDHADQYTFSIANEIAAFYAANRDIAVANGIAADWHPPQRHGEIPVTYLLKLTRSLLRHHPDIFPELVLILAPEHVSKPAAFERWLDTLLDCIDGETAQAERMRFVLIGSDAEALAWLRKRRPKHVMALQSRYGMETLPRELAIESGQRGPQGDFMRLFVELNETLAQGDAARLERVHAQALAVTQQQSWFDQSVTVHLLAGAAYLKWKDPAQALAAYEEGTRVAHQAIAAAHPAGNKLVVNSLFGEASVYWMRGDYRRAAERYVRAATFAEADRDGVLCVEAWRMVGECLSQMRRQEEALEAYLRALDFGAWIDPALRANSNVQHVAQQALAHVGFFHKRRGELNARLEALYGPNWPETIKPLPPEAVTARIMADAAELVSAPTEQS